MYKNIKLQSSSIPLQLFAVEHTLPRNPRGLDRELGLAEPQDDEVGVGAEVEVALPLLDLEDARRVEGGGLEGLDEAAAGVLDQLLDAAAEGEDGAREGVRALDDSAVAAHFDRLFAEPKKFAVFFFFHQ